MDDYSGGPDDISEFGLHAYVDGELDLSSQERMAEYLRSSPAAAARVEAYRWQNLAICLLFNADELRHQKLADAHAGRGTSPLNRARRARALIHVACAVLLAFVVACFGAWLSAYLP